MSPCVGTCRRGVDSVDLRGNEPELNQGTECPVLLGILGGGFRSSQAGIPASLGFDLPFQDGVERERLRAEPVRRELAHMAPAIPLARTHECLPRCRGRARTERMVVLRQTLFPTAQEPERLLDEPGFALRQGIALIAFETLDVRLESSLDLHEQSCIDGLLL